MELWQCGAASLDRCFFCAWLCFFHADQHTPRFRIPLWGVMLSGLVLAVRRGKNSTPAPDAGKSDSRDRKEMEGRATRASSNLTRLVGESKRGALLPGKNGWPSNF